MSILLVSQLTYLVATIAVTVLVGNTLYRHGRVFLIDVFQGNERIADAVNRLLLTGYYLVNIALCCLMIQTGQAPDSALAALEQFSRKFGFVLAILGVLHMNNVFVLSEIRDRIWRRRNANLPTITIIDFLD